MQDYRNFRNQSCKSTALLTLYVESRHCGMTFCYIHVRYTVSWIFYHQLFSLYHPPHVFCSMGNVTDDVRSTMWQWLMTPRKGWLTSADSRLLLAPSCIDKQYSNSYIHLVLYNKTGQDGAVLLFLGIIIIIIPEYYWIVYSIFHYTRNGENNVRRILSKMWRSIPDNVVGWASSAKVKIMNKNISRRKII